MDFAQDNTAVNLTEEQKAEAEKLVKDIYGVMSYLYDNLKGNDLLVGEVTTSLGLAENYLTQLAPILGYDSTLAKEKEQRYKELRQANLEIHRLTALLGTQVSADAVTGAMRRYDDIYRAWYEAEWFHYARIETTAWGITASLGYDMQLDGNDLSSLRFADRSSIAEKIAAGWLIEPDKYQPHLLARDINKGKIRDLVLRAFPHARIIGYKDRRLDSEDFGLETEMHIPYGDLEAYANSHSYTEK